MQNAHYQLLISKSCQTWEEEWYVVLYEFNHNLGEDLLFSQKLSVLDYESPVQLTDTDSKFRIDLHYGPAEAP